MVKTFAVAVIIGIAIASLAEAQSFSDGAYLVPNQMAPGTYSTAGSPYCRWLRLRSPFPRNPAAVIQEGGGSIFTTVTILHTDAMFASWKCGAWVPGDDAESLKPTYQEADAAARFVITIIGLSVRDYVEDPVARAEIRSLVQQVVKYHTGKTASMEKYADLFWETTSRR